MSDLTNQCPFKLQARTCPQCGKGLLFFKVGETEQLKCDHCGRNSPATHEERTKLLQLLDFQMKRLRGHC